MKTTDERPHLRRGLPERGVSPSGWLRTGLARGYQVHTPLHRSQKRQRRPARLFQAPNGATKPRPKSQAMIPSQAGTSCQAGASTARSRDGQPSPKSNRRQRRLARAESTPVSQRSQHPVKPTVVCRAPTLTATNLQGSGDPARSGSLPSDPSRAFAESKVSLPSQPPLTLGHRTPPSCNPQADTLVRLAPCRYSPSM